MTKAMPKGRIDGYGLYQAHIYTHLELVEGCDFCYPPPDPSQPWPVIQDVHMEGKQR